MPQVAMLAQLPLDHPTRQKPLAGAWVRFSIELPCDITDGPEKRAEIKARAAQGERKWMPWKQVTNWKLAKRTYNELGRVWTDYHEWTFTNPKQP